MPGPPPRVLLARGRAELTTVDGVPDGYLEASHRYLPEEAWDGFDAQVRAMYEQMVAIAVTPEWARLLDFETTLPQAVEELVRQRARRADGAARRGPWRGHRRAPTSGRSARPRRTGAARGS